jgi:hypothetical protein
MDKLLLHENIAHDEIEKLILGTLNDRFHKGPPGRLYLRMFLQKIVKRKNVFVRHC